MALGVGLGLRLSEALGANIEDFNVEERTFRLETQYKPRRRSTASGSAATTAR